MVSTTDYEGRPVPAKVSLKFMSRTWVKVEKKENEYDPDYEMREERVELGRSYHRSARVTAFTTFR